MFIKKKNNWKHLFAYVNDSADDKALPPALLNILKKKQTHSSQ